MGAAKDYPKLVSVIARALSHEKISRFALFEPHWFLKFKSS
jgi:hypothetical protein